MIHPLDAEDTNDLLPNDELSQAADPALLPTPPQIKPDDLEPDTGGPKTSTPGHILSKKVLSGEENHTVSTDDDDEPPKPSYLTSLLNESGHAQAVRSVSGYMEKGKFVKQPSGEPKKPPDLSFSNGGDEEQRFLDSPVSASTPGGIGGSQRDSVDELEPSNFDFLKNASMNNVLFSDETLGIGVGESIAISDDYEEEGLGTSKTVKPDATRPKLQPRLEFSPIKIEPLDKDFGKQIEISPCRDIEVRVDKPEKTLATMDTYVTFRVETRTSRADFMESVYEVRRRYSDFLWLRQRLEQEYPNVLIPPVPEKHSLYSLDRFDPSFIRARCYLLHLFLKATVAHPKLTRNNDLRTFLSAELQLFIEHMKEIEREKANEKAFVQHRKQETPGPGSPEPGFGGRISSAVMAMAGSRLSGSVSDSEFVSYGERCHELNQTLTAMEKMIARWNKTETQERQEVHSLEVVCDHWFEVEQNQLLKDVAAGLRDSLAADGNALEDLNERSEADWTLPLHHWALYAEGVKQVLRRRDSIHWEQCNAREAFGRKKSEVDALSKSQVSKLDQKKDRAKQQLEDCQSRCMLLDKQLRETNVELRKELDRWDKKRESEMKDILKRLANKKVETHRRTLEAWERLVDVLNKD